MEGQYITWWYTFGVVRCSYRMHICLIYHIQLIFNILYIALLQWKSNESIKLLPITNPGFTDLKPLGVFIVRLIKRVPGTPRDSVGNGTLSPWNDCTGLSDLNWIHRKLS